MISATRSIRRAPRRRWAGPPPHDFETGLARTVDWYLDNRDGGRRCAPALCRPTPGRPRHEGHHPGRRLRHAAVSADAGASKQLLPVYDKPMIYYPLSTLMLAGIRDILVISTPEDLPQFRRLLGDGAGSACASPTPSRPARRPRAGLHHRPRLSPARPARWCWATISSMATTSAAARGRARPHGATVFAYQVRDPERYGVVAFDAPDARSRCRKAGGAAVQLGGDRPVFLRHAVIDIARDARPSARGELEITDLNRLYLDAGTLAGREAVRGCAWLDTGTHDSCCRPPTSCKPSSRAGMLVGCPEEVAYRMGYIDAEKLRSPRSTRQDRSGPGAEGTGRGEAGMIVVRPAIPDVLLIRRRPLSTSADSFRRPRTRAAT